MDNTPRPAVACHPLPSFDESSLEAALEAFRDAPVIELEQSWLENREPGFRPATVRIGWRDDALLILADMLDDDIFSHATALNQKTWELGDAFEIFLRPAQQSAYLEFHITPENVRLQLRFPDADSVNVARATDNLTPHFLAGDVMRSHAWVREKRWFAFARIPAETVCDTPQPLAGQDWYFSFCRYDASRDCAEPVLSSSSPYEVADFHAQSAWRLMRFAK